MNYKRFIKEKIKKIKETVGKEKAISVLSGGVDSSTVTVLGKKALGKQLFYGDVFKGTWIPGRPNQPDFLGVI